MRTRPANPSRFLQRIMQATASIAGADEAQRTGR
jgi:hypothetical protein